MNHLLVEAGSIIPKPTLFDRMGLYNLHHIGITRMHQEKQGVVDANCQVHGLTKLYSN
jgi:choline dehydrogenase-like flavoprotein